MSPADAIDDIGLAGLVIAGPIPNANALGAMSDRVVHVQVLQVLLLVRDDDVHIVLASEAMVGDR